MNSEFVKENIKPLRAGRNAAQLEVASQAQVVEELQNALHQQRLEYYNQITTYQGDDPLSVWYEFILWLEQSYPKSEREGNLVTVLEECIRIFENDERYSNDGRFCKIWIKFIDMQSNALELFHMLFAKRICVGCADFYRAWAFHHELAGDYRSAHTVFATARREMAQPYQDIDIAYNAMIVNAGQHAIGIVNQVYMDEQRQAMTQLSTYKPGVVGSVRIPSGSAPILPSIGENSNSNNHRTINVAHDGSDLNFIPGLGTFDAAAASVLTLVERNAPNENIKTAGKWNVPGQSRRRLQQTHKLCEFQVHEDIVVPEQIGIQLPENFPEYTEENIAELELTLCYPDPPDDKKIPMYPKYSVYEEPNIEFSLEEIRARQYKTEIKLRLPRDFIFQSHEKLDEWYRPLYEFEPENPNQKSMYPKERVYQFCDEEFSMEEIKARQYFTKSEAEEGDEETPLFLPEPFDPNVIPMYPKQLVYEIPNKEFSLEEIKSRKWIAPQPQATMMEQDQSNHSIDMQVVYNSNSNLSTSSKGLVLESPRKNNVKNVDGTSFGNSFRIYQSPITIPIQVPNAAQTVTPMEVPTPSPTTSNLVFRGDDILVRTPTSNNIVQFDSDADVFCVDDIFIETPPANNVITIPKESTRKKSRKQPLFVREQVFEVDDSDDDEFHPFSSPNKPVTAPPSRIPFQVHDDATMTSPAKPDFRHQTPACDRLTQPGPRSMQQRGISMKTPLRDRLITDEDLAETGSRGGLDQPDVEQQASHRTVADLMDSSDTFFFNVQNVAPTSTPERKSQQRTTFAKNLSTIKEVSREYPLPRNVGSMGSMAVLEESNYEKNLAANSQANAELRSTLLKNLIGYQAEEPPAVVSPTVLPVVEKQDQQIVISNVHEPLSYVPSDPFKAAVITNLLNQIKFPGAHSETYISVFSTPRLMVRKDLCHIGKDRYLVEKCLGKGTFGSVFKAIGQQDQLVVALKFQKPANKWEYYICKEIQLRLGTNPIRQQFMEVFHGYFSDQASVLVSEYNPCGSLLDVANTFKQKSGKKVMPECLVMYFCIEMLRLVDTLHQIKIIHADIKPDNFLVMLIQDQVALQLIDFGCSIDMSLFPEGALFTRPIRTENFMCCEMRDNQPWSYHTDMFCVAASAHALLFDKYIELQKINGLWSLKERFARYLKVDLWNKFFYATLNQVNGPANADDLLTFFHETLNSIDATTKNDAMRFLKNIILNR